MWPFSEQSIGGWKNTGVTWPPTLTRNNRQEKYAEQWDRWQDFVGLDKQNQWKITRNRQRRVEEELEQRTHTLEGSNKKHRTRERKTGKIWMVLEEKGSAESGINRIVGESCRETSPKIVQWKKLCEHEGSRTTMCTFEWNTHRKGDSACEIEGEIIRVIHRRHHCRCIQQKQLHALKKRRRPSCIMQEESSICRGWHNITHTSGRGLYMCEIWKKAS